MDRDEILKRIVEMIAAQHDKLDCAPTPSELKTKTEGYIEALYQVENLILNWGLG